MSSDGILVVDANALSKRQVGLINQVALAFYSAGAFVIFVECTTKPPTTVSKNRLKRAGYSYHELVQIEQKYYEMHDSEVLSFATKTAENNSDGVLVLTGSAMVMYKLTEKGIGAMLYA